MSPSRVLLVFAAVAVGLVLASDWLLLRSETFWGLLRERAVRPGDEALQLEARLRLRDPDSDSLLFLGNSLVQTDVSQNAVARALALSPRQVEKLWLPAANGLEMAMLTPDIAELRPRLVVYLATVWNLHAEIELDAVRLYHPGFAMRVYGLPEVFHERAAHASKLIASQHVVVRHRDRLRRLIFANSLRMPEDLDSDVQIQAFRDERDHAVRADFDCANVQTRALEQMALELAEAGVALLVAVAPVNYPWGRDPELRTELDACLSALGRESGFSYLGANELPEFAPELFSDDLHLVPRGRRRYTEHLLPRIAELWNAP